MKERNIGNNTGTMSRREFLKCVCFGAGAAGIALTGIGCSSEVGNGKETSPSSTLPNPQVRVTSSRLTEEEHPVGGTLAPTAETTEISPEVCNLSFEEQFQILIQEGVAGKESVPLITEGPSKKFLGGEVPFQELRAAVDSMAGALVGNGITKIEVPMFAAELVNKYPGVEITPKLIDNKGNVLPTPDGFYSIEAKGFQTGGWGVFVKGPDGFWRVPLPRGDRDLANWLTYAQGEIDLYTLPAQAAYGELVFVKLNGCRWTAVQLDSKGKVLAVLKPTGDVEDENAIWQLEASLAQRAILESMSDEEIFAKIGVPNPLEYKLDRLGITELKPYKVIRGGEGTGTNYALFTGPDGVVYLSHDLATGKVEHAIYSEYEEIIDERKVKGVPLLVLTDESVLAEGGWMALDPEDRWALHRLGKGFHQALALAWWNKNHPFDKTQGTFRSLDEIPGFSSRYYILEIPQTRRNLIVDYMYKKMFEDLVDARNNGFSMEVTLRDLKRTELDLARSTIVIRLVKSDEVSWKDVTNFIAYNTLSTKLVLGEKKGGIVILTVRYPAYYPRNYSRRDNWFSSPVGGMFTQFLCGFFGGEYYDGRDDYPPFTYSEGLTGTILETMCSYPNLPSQIWNRFHGYGYPDWITLKKNRENLIVENCAVQFFFRP